MQVHLDDLRTICERLFAHLKELDISEIEVEQDYYWDLPAEARFNVYEQPVVSQIGQLSDDWADLCKVLQGTAEPIAYNLVDLAAILRVVGETIVR